MSHVSAINPLDGCHFDNLNLSGLLDYEDDGNVVTEGTENKKLDDQFVPVENVRNQFAQGSGIIEQNEFVDENDRVQQQRTQFFYEEDFEPVEYRFNNQQYTSDNRKGDIDYAGASEEPSGGSVNGNYRFANYYNQQPFHGGPELIGNGQLQGNHFYSYAAQHQYFQNLQPFESGAHTIEKYGHQAQHNSEKVTEVYDKPQFSKINNQENQDPSTYGVQQHQQFNMPEYPVGLGYANKTPQRQVEEEEPTGGFVLDVATANTWLNQEVDFIDTDILVAKMRTWMKDNDVHQEFFAERILGKGQGYFCGLLTAPKQFTKLNGKKVNYIRMDNFLNYTIEYQLAFLQLQLVPPKQEKPADYQKKARTNFTDAQKRKLRELFAKNPKAQKPEKGEIARKVGLTYSNVHHFFKNALKNW